MSKTSPSFSPLFNEQLKLMNECPLCNASKDAVRAEVVEENEDAHVLHMQCAQCGSAILALIVHAGNGVTSVGILTDLTRQDVKRFRGARIIETDDALDLFASLKDSAGVRAYVRDLA